MAIRVYHLALAAGAIPLTDAYEIVAGGGPTTAVTQAANIPYRQLIFQTLGANAMIGKGTDAPSNGIQLLSTGGIPLVIGPFETGPVKLSDFYASGAGATLMILGVPF